MQHSGPIGPPRRIDVICGCMFSGKTARLIDELYAAGAGGHRVLAFKHRLDRRYGLSHLATHDGRRFPATAAATADELAAGTSGADVVGIDEAQFFGRGLVDVCRALRETGMRVIVAGIHHDAWGRPFPPLPELRRIADSVELLHVPCRVCGQPAEYSQRMVPVTDPDLVGGPREYEPRCWSCFRPLPPPAPDY
jgi:thymidine kinase